MVVVVVLVMSVVVMAVVLEAFVWSWWLFEALVMVVVAFGVQKARVVGVLVWLKL